MTLRHALNPCGECPWRTDQPAGRFPPERYEALRETSQTRRGGSAPLGSAMFACHKTAEGKEIACAGWLAIEGAGHVGVRVAVVTGGLDPEALEPKDWWPELHQSFAELARFNGAEVEE